MDAALRGDLRPVPELVGLAAPGQLEPALDRVPWASPAATLTVSVAVPLAGTVTEVGVEIRLSPVDDGPAAVDGPEGAGCEVEPLLGDAKRRVLPVRLVSVIVSGVAFVALAEMRPNEADTGANVPVGLVGLGEVLAAGALEHRPDDRRRVERVGHHRVGGVDERRLDLRRRPVRVEDLSTAAEPVTCGEDIDVPL